jgi:hypothetical protein
MLQSVQKYRLFCENGGVTKGSFSVHIYLYIVLHFYDQKTTLIVSTFKSQLNIPGQGNPMFAGRQPQWPLNCIVMVPTKR